MFKIVASLFALMLIVNLVESQNGYDCYEEYNPRDGSCHNGFTNQPSAGDCCRMSARACGGNGWNGHCEPCYKNVGVQNY